MTGSDQIQVSAQMPCYKSHKKVWALQIKSIEIVRPTIAELEEILHSESEVPVTVLPDGSLTVIGDEKANVGAIITPEEEGYAPFPVTREYVRKHNPQPGGYYVVYADGYKSWSPAQAFEEGYTLVS